MKWLWLGVTRPIDPSHLTRDAQQYIVVPIYCTIDCIVENNIIYCKASKYWNLFLQYIVNPLNRSILEFVFTIYRKPA